MFLNLVGGEVKIRAEAREREVLVSVADTGIGIADEDLEHIFERFYRAKDDRVAQVRGSGLGLCIARESVRLQGGDLVVRSELNAGSCFTLKLPVDGPEGI